MFSFHSYFVPSWSIDRTFPYTVSAIVGSVFTLRSTFRRLTRGRIVEPSNIFIFTSRKRDTWRKTVKKITEIVAARNISLASTEDGME